MDKPCQSSSTFCKTLARALKRVFQTIKFHSLDSSVNGPVDIIRRDATQTAYLPRISTVSLLPDFEKINLHVERLKEHVPVRPLPVPASNAGLHPQKSLLPARSLSHFNLRHACSLRSEQPISQSERAERFQSFEPAPTPTTYKAPVHNPVLIHPKPSLLIRHQSLRASITGGRCTESILSNSPSPTLRRTKVSADLQSSSSNLADSFRLVKHFASFCLLDVSAPGCPVSAVSEDLQYVYDIRDRFFLNAQECAELSMDFSVGRDPNGNEVTYVMLYSPLISLGISTSRFMMVSAIDVSGHVRYAASLETSTAKHSKHSPLSSFKERCKNPQRPPSRSGLLEIPSSFTEDLAPGRPKTDLKDSKINENFNIPRESECRPQLEADIWTTIAQEEGLMCHVGSTRSKPGPKPLLRRHVSTRSAVSKSSLDCSDETVLESFVHGLQVLYSQYFALAYTPLKDQFYEIEYVSPAVYASGEWISGHLSHTQFNLMTEFQAHLAAGKRFRAILRWGNQGVQKQLFCVPLMGHQPDIWLCILVDKDTPIRW